MKEYKLGPNGAILTALNLYLSQPETILNKIKLITTKHFDHPNTFVIDIPGQIEVFTWSSSSLILIETIASLMPVKIVYIIDSVRCNNPNVFLSNVLFARNFEVRQNPSNFVSTSSPLLCYSTRPTAVTPRSSNFGLMTMRPFCWL